MIKGKSQYDEDLIIDDIFNKINISKGTYFEIGVNNLTIDRSIQCNSIKLINRGWKGHLIDANFKHPLVLNKFISINNIKEISKIAGRQVDFFSIDIDSYDWHIIREILEKNIIDVNVFCVETNNYNGDCFLDRVLKLDAPAPNTENQPKSDSFGATTFSYNLLMVRYGFKLVATSHFGVNAFFVKKKFSHLFPKAGKIRKLYKDSNNLLTNWNRKGPIEFMTTARNLLKL
tara:strand:- start:417 stop:1109 length:693 start_codon:yes stop_codon:yes gene_type:complete